MEIVWEIARHALGLAISIPVLLIGILWLWFSIDGFGKLQLSYLPLVLAVGYGHALFGMVGALMAIVIFTPVMLWLIRRIFV